jgi:hypothetical protein
MKTPAVLRITLALGARSRTSRLGATREAVLCSVRFNGTISICAEVREVPIATERIATKQDRYSITSSARARSDVGTSIPRALAVLLLMTNWKWVGCSTGSSAG